MTAQQRLAALDTLPAADLCARTEHALQTLASVMNAETTLLRTGRFAEAAPLAAEKAQCAETYVVLARAVDRQASRLKREAPTLLAQVSSGHERLATQMAENLRVLATARTVAESLLNDVASAVGRAAQPRVYGAKGHIGAAQAPIPARQGLALDRAL